MFGAQWCLDEFSFPVSCSGPTHHDVVEGESISRTVQILRFELVSESLGKWDREAHYCKRLYSNIKVENGTKPFRKIFCLVGRIHE